MNNIQQRINEINTNGYDLDFSNVFNASIENYKKIAINAGIAFILFSIILGIIVMSLIGGIFGFSSFATTMTNFNLMNFSAIGIIGYLVFVVLITALIQPFYAGIVKMAFLADENQEFSIGTATEYYKGDYFKEIFIATILITGISASLNMLLEYTGIFFVGALITYITAFFTFLVNPLIIFGNLKAVEAIKTSFMVVTKQAPVLIGLLFVSLIMCCLGFIGLCIGVFFTFPFIFSVYYIIYKQIFGLNPTSEIDEIGAFQE